MTRTYTIAQYKGDSRKPVVSVTYDNPEDALLSYAAAIVGAGHDDSVIPLQMRTWAAVLMAGGQALTLLDPDLSGWISISITVST